MKKRLLIFGGLCLIVLLIGILAWALLDTRGPEPSYQGKPLSYWLQGYDNSALMPAVSSQQATDALTAAGPDAVPVLMRMLKRKDSKLKAGLIYLARKQKFLSLRVREDQWDNFIATQAFAAMGPTGSNAVPQLIELFNTDPSPFRQQAVPEILGYLGSTAKSAIPTLIHGTTHTNFIVRNNSVFALGQICECPDVVVPALAKCLQDSDSLVAAQAAEALGKFGRAARVALPALRQLAGKQPSKSGSGGNVPFCTSVSTEWQSPNGATGLNPSNSPNVPGAARDAIEKINAAIGPEPDAK
jgi:HEAT repeat protein